MKAHELAKKLLEGPDLELIIAGYEGGVNILDVIGEPVTVLKDVHDAWYYGKHEIDRFPERKTERERFQAIELGVDYRKELDSK